MVETFRKISRSRMQHLPVIGCEKEKKKNRFLRRLSQLSRRSMDSLSSGISYSRTPSPRSTFSDYANPCELVLVSALQGTTLSSEEMRACALEIQNLSDTEKSKLTNFFKESDVACIIENNAFKIFSCSNLTTDCFTNNITALTDLWTTIRKRVIPTLEAMCYPLQSVDSSFDVQSIILTAFRDRVLSKVLQDVTEEIKEIETILLTILTDTENVSSELRQKIDICLGKPQQNKPKYNKKYRSRTDSYLNQKRKSVTWIDDMKDMRKTSTSYSS